MATIARLVVELEAKTAQFHQAMDESVRELGKAAHAVNLLQQRVTTLQRAFRTGVISEEEFARGLRTLQADIAELANKANLSEKAMAQLSKVGSTVTRELRNVTAIARRTADGFEAIGVSVLAASQAVAGGAGGIGRAASTLGVFALGNPVMIGILAGLTALASAWELIRNRSREAIQAAADFSRLRLTQRGISADQTQEAIAAEIRDRERRLAETSTVAGSMGRSGVRTPDRLVQVLRGAERAAVQEELANLRTIQLLNTGRLATETGISGQLGNQANKLAAQLATLKDIEKIAAKLGGGGHGFPAGFGPIEPTLEFQQRVKQQQAVAQSAADVGRGVLDQLDPFSGFVERAEEFKGVTFEIGAAIADGLTALAVGAASGFKNMGNLLLGILGGLMVEIGHSMIVFGTAMKAIRQAISNPVAAIAAGVALVALGSALASSAQGSINRATGGGGGGGGGGGSFASVPRSSVAEGTSRPVTVIQVVAQDGRVITEQVLTEGARLSDRGNRVPGTAHQVQLDNVTVVAARGA